MKRTFFYSIPSVLCLVVTLNMNAQYPSNLYGEELRDWIKANYYDGDHTNLGYFDARREMYSYTDEQNGQIECIYTGFTQASEYTTFPDPINTEHVVPQSFFGTQEPMRSDIHVLRPSHGEVNGARSNYPFGEVQDVNAIWHGLDSFLDYEVTITQPLVFNGFSETDSVIFEPREDKKGDIARQVFYFYTVYPTQAGSISQVGDISILYQWHLQDPADASEVQRNNRIEVVQGNRNPYIRLFRPRCRCLDISPNMSSAHKFVCGSDYR